jgi:hypothetical protein
MTNAPELPAINLYAIDFPTNHLTIGKLIDRFPRSFAWTSPENQGFQEETEASEALWTAMDIERNLAKAAFELASNEQDPRHSDSNPWVGHPRHGAPRSDEIEILAKLYVQFGLAHGPAETMEHVRSIEAQARKQVPDRRR